MAVGFGFCASANAMMPLSQALGSGTAFSQIVKVGSRHVVSDYARNKGHYSDYGYDQGTQVDAPFTHVETSHGRVVVDAPYAYVKRTRRSLRVRAPFVDIQIPR